jgi:hypothetical protein
MHEAGVVVSPPPANPPAQAAAIVLRHRLAFRGEGLALFTLILKNMLLTLVIAKLRKEPEPAATEPALSAEAFAVLQRGCD